MVPASAGGSGFGSDLNKKSLNQNFGTRLQEIRLQKGITTQKELAELIGVNKNSIQRYETGELPNGKILLALSNTFKCSIDWLLKGTPEESILPSRPQSKGQPQNNVVELKHADVIRRFVDKSYALDLNLSLVELERMSPEAYKKVGAYIKGVVDGVRMMTSMNANNRTETTQEQMTSEEETESLTNRTAANR